MNNILIVGEFSFPKGAAAANFVYLLAKGLVHAGASVLVLPLHASEKVNDIRNTAAKGRIENIDFVYTSGDIIWKPNLVRRILLRVRSGLVSLQILLSKKLSGDLDVIIYYGHSFYNLAKFRIITRLLGVKFIPMIVEWDPARPNATKKQISIAYKSFDFSINTSDGLVVISQFLKDKVKERTAARKKPLSIFVMPILMDPEKWETIKPLHKDKRYVLYCAHLGTYLDDALFVIDAFSILNNDDYDLVLVGPADNKKLEVISRKIQSIGLKDKVTLITKYIEQKKLYELFSGAEALLAPLHDNDRSKGRFPFKIADYLMSSRPVVTCGVGAVAKILVNEHNAFLAEPDNLVDFSNKIQQSVNSNNKEQIGINGKNTALANFDYRIQCKQLMQYLDSI